jgi:hypothetical protein
MKEFQKTLKEVTETIYNQILEYVQMARGQALVLTLWIVHTYLASQAEFTPYIHVTAAEKACGKSRLLEILGTIASNPQPLNATTASAIWTAIESEKTTLIIDEIDTVLGDKARRSELLRATLNLGFRKGQTITRATGKSKVTEFEVFCPKVMAGIGTLPDTIAQRCIPIKLSRKKPGQGPRFRLAEFEKKGAVIREALTKLSEHGELLDLLKNIQVEIPEELEDRQADISEPLVAIAKLIGGEQSEKTAIQALTRIFREDVDRSDSEGTTLLKDIHSVFGNTPSLWTTEILRGLINLENGSPWASKWESALERGMTQAPANELARRLHPYKIKPRTLRRGRETAKGYSAFQFEEAWADFCGIETQRGRPMATRALLPQYTV